MINGCFKNLLAIEPKIPVISTPDFRDSVVSKTNDFEKGILGFGHESTGDNNRVG